MNWEALQQSVSDFFKYKVLKLSASLAFFTFFSFPSMLVLLISASGYLFGKDAVKGRIFSQIKDWVGTKAATQIQDILKTVYVSENNNWTTWLAFALLVLTAQSVFEEIKDSLRTIYEVKVKPQKDWATIIFNRIVSFVLVAIAGFVLTFSLSINWALTTFSQKIKDFLPTGASLLISFSNYLSTSIIFVGIATFIYRFLPEVKVYWRPAFHGAICATVLLLIGKYGIGIYLNYNATLSAYTAASSLILVLIWVYYSSLVLYFGAIYTKAINTGYRPKTKRKPRKTTQKAA